LVEALRSRGLPVTFVEIHDRGTDSRGLPWVTNACEVSLPYR
jgi:hypothetical protein